MASAINCTVNEFTSMAKSHTTCSSTTVSFEPVQILSSLLPFLFFDLNNFEFELDYQAIASPPQK